MFKIEKIGPNSLYIKAIGTFPPPVAKNFVNEFEQQTKKLKSFSIIVDITDATFLKLSSIKTILNLLKKNNKKLVKSAFVIAHNPPLNAEFQYLLEKAHSSKRKIVNNLEDAKKWLDISEIVIGKD